MFSILLLLAVSTAPSAELTQAERAFSAGEYQEVQPLVARALAGSLSNAERVRALLELLAITSAAFANGRAAVDAFERVLRLAPGYRPPASASPKVLSAFGEAKAGLDVAAALALPPSTAPVTARSEPPVWKRWWFWTAAGVLVAGGAVAAVQLSRGQVPPGDLGTDVLR
jgi:hypothetical protein